MTYQCMTFPIMCHGCGVTFKPRVSTQHGYVQYDLSVHRCERDKVLTRQEALASFLAALGITFSKE
jgi:hypothetical protein